MLIRDVEIDATGDRRRVDVRLRDAAVFEIGIGLSPGASERIVSGAGGALIPGLHDHHIHLLSLAAAQGSVRCGPPELRDAGALARALRAAAATPGQGNAWIRGTGYHESVAGDLDADTLGAISPARPVRLQHRSGALWIINRAGLAELGLADGPPVDLPPGAERDAAGRLTGRFYRTDEWLRERIGAAAPPDLSGVGERLARYGVSGVTDATPGNSASELQILSEAVARGALRQQVRVMGSKALPEPHQAGVTRGAVKLVLDEARALDLDETALAIREAHAGARPAAVHCVTRAELVVALAAFECAGSAEGDRIEHGAIAPPELVRHAAALGLTVVTQPNFVRERGDAYRRDVAADDLPWLYRCQGLLDADIALGGGTDAPFGDPDPWLAIQAAVDRRTSAGETLGDGEALSPERALALFTTPADAPGGPPRRVAEGQPAHLCLLDRSWSRARDSLEAGHVAATWSAGRLTWLRQEAG